MRGLRTNKRLKLMARTKRFRNRKMKITKPQSLMKASVKRIKTRKIRRSESLTIISIIKA